MSEPGQKETHHISFREVTPDDEPFEVMMFDLTRLAPVGFPPELRELLAPQQIRLQRASYLVQFPDAKWRIILVDGQSAGRSIIEEDDENIHIVDIAIIPKYSGSGIGTRIMKQLQERAGRKGKSITLAVDKMNVRAKAFYARLGFLDTEGATETHYRMKWDLTSSE